jgi:hypothetical protein
MEKGWKLIYTVNQLFQAELAKQILEEQGITAVVINKRDSSYTTFGRFEIYCADKDVDAATEIVKNAGI